MTEEKLSTEELLKKIEEAAQKGAKSGNKKSNLAIIILCAIILAAVFFAFFGGNRISANVNEILDELVTREDSADSHDLVIDDHGLFGYTSADFAEAVLGKQEQLKKLEIYTAEIDDATTITDAGLLKLEVFSKHQILTYHGEVVYSVDLSKLSEDDIMVDEESKTVTISIPHAQKGKITIPSDKIEFGDVDKGFLAIGKLKLTPEQIASVQTEAENKMNSKLEEENVIETADRFATLSVWEMYQPIITSVSPAYKLEVVFK